MNVAAAVSDPVRREILGLLRDRSMAAGEIAGLFEISRPAVSRHLRVLRECGLVTDELRGRQRIYRLDVRPLAELDSWLGGFRALWQRTKRPTRVQGEDSVTPIPTGRMIHTPRGRDLVLRRSFRASIDDVWASVTESERTARWFGSWVGEAGPGNTVRLTMTFEEGAEPSDLQIEECEPPHHLVVSMVDEAGPWLMELELTERDGATELRLTHHLDDEADPASAGPGWEYYLDNLVASREDAPLPAFEDYYPSQKAYYEQTPVG